MPFLMTVGAFKVIYPMQAFSNVILYSCVMDDNISNSTDTAHNACLSKTAEPLAFFGPPFIFSTEEARYFKSDILIMLAN